MVPFLQNANNLLKLHVGRNNIQSEGFNVLFRALRDSPIETLICARCGIESIEIDDNSTPRNLRHLNLIANSINADGCREVAKLLQGGDSTLGSLFLTENKIDDEGVEILVDALQNNTSLKTLNVGRNDGISNRGKIMLLKLVNDISSIKATLQSNHTLTQVIGELFKPDEYELDPDDEIIKMHINNAVAINMRNKDNPEVADREKVIQTQLHSETRAELADLQGVNRSLYSEIGTLHLPEVLALVGRIHGQGELYAALKSSIAGVISTVNEKQCIQDQMAYHAAKLEELGARLAVIEAVEGDVVEAGSESQINKRRRA